MKRFLNIIIGIALVTMTIMSCSEQKKSEGKKFAPQERTSSLSAEERSEAIAKKKAEMEVSLDTLLYGHGVKFAIVQPKLQGEDITQDIADRISMKLLQIASQNGISGIGSYNFAFGTEIAQTNKATTGTAPQKMTVKYDLTFKVMNTLTGDVYATTTQEIMGVGNSFVEANQNAVNEIKNTPQMQKMLQKASQSIVDWYNQNSQVVKNQVEKVEGEGNYALALALLNSIPEQATETYKYVGQKQDTLLKRMLHKQAADMLGEMEALLASSGDEFNPAVSAYFRLIPTDCPEHATAQKLYAEYEKKCNARRSALETKAVRDEQAARELEKLKKLYDHESELATIEADKVKSKYEAMASAKAATAQIQANTRPHGLFGSLGYAISGTFERIFKVADTAGDFLSEQL